MDFASVTKLAGTTFTYRRVSTSIQSDGQSLNAQLEQMRDYAKRNNLIISKEYEEVQSAKDSNRPVFNQMIKDIRRYKPKALVVHKLDNILEISGTRP